jgi:hypothetical protein
MRTWMTVAVLIISASSASAFEVPRSVPQSIDARYQALYKLQTEALPDGSVRLGPARLMYRGGIRVLYVAGDAFEMAYQHGRLLREDIVRGALPQTANIIKNTVLNSFPQIPLATDTAIKTIYNLYSGGMIDYAVNQQKIPRDQFLADAYGIARGAGLSLDQVIFALTGPESLQVLLGERAKGNKQLPAPLMVNECTDFTAPSASGDGMIVGRNTDYPLNGTFDRYPTVVYYHPSDGGQAYMSVTSAGLHTAGVVGFNASGLYLGIHTIPTAQVSKAGLPAFYIGEQVLRHARSFDQAVNLFRTMKPAAGWTYTLVSTGERRAASVEITNQGMGVRESNDSWHAQSNHFITSEMSSANLDLNATINQDSRARLLRAENLIAEAGQTLTATDAVRILSDKVDPFTGDVSAFGNVIAVHTTLTSAVFDTSAGKAFVASGTAPVSLTPFIELPLAGALDPEKFDSTDYETITNDGFHTDHPSLSRAEQLYIRAKSAYETELDTKKSASILSQVMTQAPGSMAYAFVYSIMSLKSGDVEGAKRALWNCAESDHPHYRLACRYYLGRIAASRGERNAATSLLSAVIAEANPEIERPLLNAAKNSLKKLKQWGRHKLNAHSIAIFMPEADVVEY